jgi:hypothetical protein
MGHTPFQFYVIRLRPQCPVVRANVEGMQTCNLAIVLVNSIAHVILILYGAGEEVVPICAVLE